MGSITLFKFKYMIHPYIPLIVEQAQKLRVFWPFFGFALKKKNRLKIDLVEIGIRDFLFSFCFINLEYTRCRLGIDLVILN